MWDHQEQQDLPVSPDLADHLESQVRLELPAPRDSLVDQGPQGPQGLPEM